MKKPEDFSLCDQSLFGSIQWCATRLGRSYDWFVRNRKTLEADGFPCVDGVVRLTNKKDVDAWIARRRRLRDDVGAVTIGGAPHAPLIKENLNAF